MQRFCVPAFVAVAAICFSAPAPAQFAQSVIITTSSDDADFQNFPLAAETRTRTGPYSSVFLRSGGVFSSDPQEFQNGVPANFTLRYQPPGAGEEGFGTFFFDLGTFSSSVPADTADFDVVLLRAATQGFQGQVRVDKINVQVFGVQGGNITQTANATPTQPLRIVSLRSFNMALGFTVKGRVTFFGSLPQIDMRFDTRVVDSGAEPPAPGSAPDRDLDQIPDVDDNCPDDPNFAQRDRDEDGIGDVCDVCPDDNDPNGIDLDYDGIPDVCDNCPGSEAGDTALRCDLFRDSPDETCSNPMQLDDDGDGIGNKCDNCFMTPNPKLCSEDGTVCRFQSDCEGEQTCAQPNSDGVGKGDACTDPGADMFAGGAPPLPGGAPLTLGGPVKSGEGDETTFTLRVNCANSNVATANIPIFVPNNVTAVNFENCLLPAGDERIGSCNGSTVPPNVNPLESQTRGRSVVVPANVPNQLFIVSVVGNTPVAGLARDVLCTTGDSQEVGVLTLTNLGPNDAPFLSPQGLDQYTVDAMGRCVPTQDGLPPAQANRCPVLFDSEGVSITTPVLTTQGTAVDATVELVPALDDPIGARRWQLTVQSPFLIKKMAFGLVGFVGIQPEQGTFGGCDIPHPIPGQPTVNVCPGRVDGMGMVQNGDLGPGVAGSDATPASAIPGSYVLPPNAPGRPPGLLDHVTYVVLTGGINQPLPFPPFAGLSLNQQNATSFGGVFTYDFLAPEVPPLPPPGITFEGVTSLPGVTNAIELTTGGTIPPINVLTIGGSESPTDTDLDGVGDPSDNCVTTPNSDQTDGGRVLSIVPDRIGRTCQCGDSVNNGQVADDDFSSCQDALAEGVESPDAERCAVTQGPTFSILDLVTLELKLSEGGVCVGGDLPGGACLAAQDCPNEGICSGKCLGGDLPGDACNEDVDCPNGGICTVVGQSTGASVDQVCPQAAQ